jgi:4-coumarate--CoA ligase
LHLGLQVLRFDGLRSLTKRLAYGLVNREKLSAGDVIMAFSPNSLLYPAFVLATQAATLCVSVSLFFAFQCIANVDLLARQLANPSYLFDELVHHIKDSRPKVLVVGKSVIEVAKRAAIECGIADQNIYMMEEEAHEQYKSIWSLAGHEELEPLPLSPKEARQRTAFMCYSSGTTGKPKGGTSEPAIDITNRTLIDSECSADNSLQCNICRDADHHL